MLLVWSEALNGIRRHPLRSFLVFLTFALGAASTVITIATVEGGRRSITNDLQGLGVDVIASLNPIRVGPIALGAMPDGGKPIDGSMVEELRAELRDDPAIRAVVPFRMELGQIRNERWVVTTTVMATTPEFAGILRAGLLAGRFLEAGDGVSGDPRAGTSRPVPVVLDEALARQLAPEPESLVGTELQSFRVGQPFTVEVVGIMRDPITLRRHLDAFDANKRARNVTARRLEFRNLYVRYDPAVDEPSGVLVQLLDLDAIPRITDLLERFFEERAATPFFFVQKLWIDSVIDIVDRFSSLSHFIWLVDLFIVLLLVATISLLAVEERYREIAIRRVEGASIAQVVWPLLVEGGLLALVSLPVGYAIAEWLLGWYIRPILLWEPIVPRLAIVGLPFLLLGVGLASNGLAARRVARLSPAAVLSRYEG